MSERHDNCDEDELPPCIGAGYRDLLGAIHHHAFREDASPPAATGTTKTATFNRKGNPNHE